MHRESDETLVELVERVRDSESELEMIIRRREHAEYMSRQVFPGITRQNYDSWRNEGN